jgi:TPR repeat protein
MTNPRRVLVRLSFVLVSTAWAMAAAAADDTARFYGTWTTTTVVNGQTMTIVSVHDAHGYTNVVRTPTGDVPAGDGTFTAVNNAWRSNAPAPNDHGGYRFVDNDTVIATNALGQTVTWVRSKTAARSGPVDANTAAKQTTGYVPPGDRPGTTTAPAAASTPSVALSAASPATSGPDPSLSPAMNAGMQAFIRKDYTTAWRTFMAEAQKGDPDGEAAVGSMLFGKVNPPGTGYYAQCERWLLLSANKGNAHGMDMLAQYYFAEGRRIAGGINPGVNTTRISPQEQKMADDKFAQSRQWFERAVAKGDIYAMGNLAILLDAGLGGPKDEARANQLRAAVDRGPDANFKRKVTLDPGNLALSASWQAGHYADAISAAQASAAKGDAHAQALLGRAYYLGTGVPRNYATALGWLSKAVAQHNGDAMFILGLMYEHGAGVNQDLPRALKLFDDAAAMGHGYAAMEAKGMRMQGEANRQAAMAPRNGVMATACAGASGVYTSSGECLKTGVGAIDPFDTRQAVGP